MWWLPGRGGSERSGRLAGNGDIRSLDLRCARRTTQKAASVGPCRFSGTHDGQRSRTTRGCRTVRSHASGASTSERAAETCVRTSCSSYPEPPNSRCQHPRAEHEQLGARASAPRATRPARGRSSRQARIARRSPFVSPTAYRSRSTPFVSCVAAVRASGVPSAIRVATRLRAASSLTGCRTDGASVEGTSRREGRARVPGCHQRHSSAQVGNRGDVSQPCPELP